MPRSVWSQQQHKCQSWCLGGMWVGQPLWFTKYSRPLPVHQCWTTITLVRADDGTADGLQLTGLSLWHVTVPILNLKLNLKCRVWELTGGVIISLQVHPTLWPLNAPYSNDTNDLLLVTCMAPSRVRHRLKDFKLKGQTLNHSQKKM